jgi:hypothetical protein
MGESRRGGTQSTLGRRGGDEILCSNMIAKFLPEMIFQGTNAQILPVLRLVNVIIHDSPIQLGDSSLESTGGKMSGQSRN